MISNTNQADTYLINLLLFNLVPNRTMKIFKRMQNINITFIRKIISPKHIK